MNHKNREQQPILIWGMSGHARVIADLILCQGSYQLIGFIDQQAKEESCLGYPWLGDDERISSLLNQYPNLAGVVAIGDNGRRYQVVQKILTQYPQWSFATLIHPSVQIGQEVTVGRGSIIMAQAVIQAGSHVGEFCIVNTKASLDHDGHLGDYASLAPGVTAGGGVTIGKGSAIGLGAHIIHNIHIGEECVVGAGACVVKDLPNQVVAYGVPARIIRSREIGERYL